jgi:hypothetical protein
MNERIKELASQVLDELVPETWTALKYDKIKEIQFRTAELIIEECAREVEEFARKWWSIHCHSNKHAETTRKAHDDFCALQVAIRRRGKTE